MNATLATATAESQPAHLYCASGGRFLPEIKCPSFLNPPGCTHFSEHCPFHGRDSFTLKANFLRQKKEIRILLIDDSSTALARLSEALTEGGFQYRKLATLNDLAPAMKSYQPDVVFLDINMPGLNGELVGSFIRDSQDSRVRMVIFSCASENRRLEVAQNVGAIVALDKVATNRQIHQAVETAMLLQHRASK